MVHYSDMQNRFFITGTDTGVGKTMVTAALMVAMQSQGIRCIPVKPIQCGCREGIGDHDWCLSFSTLSLTEEDKKAMNTYRFNLPASPHLAARQENAVISSQRIAEAIDHLAQRFDVLLIEGAGGLRVPLNDDEHVIDLIELTKSAPIVVTRANLGTLNHTAMTMREIALAELTPAAVVINETVMTRTKDEQLIHDDNIKQITRMAAPAPVVVFGHQTNITHDSLLTAGLPLLSVLRKRTLN